MKTFKTQLIFCLLLLISLPIFAKKHVLKQYNIPGGVVEQPIPCNYKAYFHNFRVLTISKNKQCIAFIGIPLATKPGKKILVIKNKTDKQMVYFNIIEKKYPIEKITLKRHKKGKPNKEIAARFKLERKIIRAAFQHWSNNNNINLAFKLPVKGRFSSPFGVKRIYNGKTRSRHRGMDIAAPRGTPIKAPANGTVINTGKFLILGKTIFLDHGQNLITVYCHLNKILVKPKQKIKQGQIIAQVGSTGRSTGPHLHWGVSLNNTRVNPKLFLG